MIGGVVYAYLYYREVKTPISEALNAVPSNVSLILETKQAKNAWKKLSENSVIWEDLLSTDFFHRLNKSGNFIDSLFSSDKDAYPLIEGRSVFISAHMAGAKDFDFLYTFSLPDLTKESLIDRLIENSSADKEALLKKVYDEVVIKSVKFMTTEEIFSYTVYRGIFIASFNQTLVEDAIRQLNSGTTIVSDKNFMRVMNTAGDKSDANLFINYKTFPDVVATFLKQSTRSTMDFLSGFADWSEMDLTIRTNALRMNGYTYSNDSVHNYLNIFAKQKPQNINLTSVIPASTSTVLFFGIENFKTFNRDYKSYLETQRKLFDYEKSVEAWNKKYKTDIEKYMLPWVSEEMALVVTEPSKKSFGSNTFAVFHATDIEIAKQKIDSLSTIVRKKEDADTITYRGFAINQLRIPRVIGTLFGDCFNNVEKNFYTTVNDYVVFGNSKTALKSFINEFVNGRTLDKNSYYIEFSKNNLTEDASIYLYSNIARSTNIYKNYVKEEYESDIKKHLELFQRFEAVAIQISSDKDNMFYNNIYLKHNPVYKKESGSMWEASLDTTVSSRPYFVLNAQKKTGEAIVQDDGYSLYLIGPDGKVIWKKKLDEKIMGEVHQTDYRSNGKLQYVFNTKNKIYMIDSKGRDVRKYPIELKSPATAPISIFDYDSDKDYRILVTCENRRIYNYTAFGEQVSGFKFGKTEDVVTSPLNIFKIDDKEYLVIVDKSGNAYVTNRKGEKQIKLKEKIVSADGKYFVEVGKSLGYCKIVCVDKKGGIQKLAFIDKLEYLKLHSLDDSPQFLCEDLDGDKVYEYIFLQGKTMLVFDQNKEKRFEYDFPENITSSMQFFRMSDGTGRVGAVCATTNEVYLIDRTGKLSEGFPFYGALPFSIGDLNKDGSLNIITGTGECTIYAYTTE